MVYNFQSRRYLPDLIALKSRAKLYAAYRKAVKNLIVMTYILIK